MAGHERRARKLVNRTIDQMKQKSFGLYQSKKFTLLSTTIENIFYVHMKLF